MAKRIKLSKSLEWIRPFLPAARYYVSLARIKSIRGYTVPLDKCEDGLASCLRDEEDGLYSINILTHTHSLRVRKGRTKYTEGSQRRDMHSILADLAHELGHQPTWRRSVDHTPDHWVLEAKIMCAFAKKAKKIGIIDTWLPPANIPELNFSDPEDSND